MSSPIFLATAEAAPYVEQVSYSRFAARRRARLIVPELQQFIAIVDQFISSVPEAVQAELFDHMIIAVREAEKDTIQYVPTRPGRIRTSDSDDEDQGTESDNDEGDDDPGHRRRQRVRRVRSKGNNRAGSGDEQDDDEDVEDIDYVADLPLAFDLDSHNCTRTQVREMAQRAFDLLNGRTYTIIKSSRPVQHVISPAFAGELVKMFFQQMFGTVLDRVQGIVDGIEAYNAAQTTGTIAISPGTPMAVQRLYVDLSTLAGQDMAAALNSLRRNMSLVNFRKNWTYIKEVVGTDSEAGRSIVDFFQLGRPTVGRTYASMAKAALCAQVNISDTTYKGYIKSSHLPSALVKHFGRGALLLCPDNLGQ